MTIEHLHGAGAILLLLASVGLAWVGQPGPAEKWDYLASELGPRLTERHVQIEPAELLELMYDDYIDLRIVDVREERDWNLFHLWGAQRITAEELPRHHKSFAQLPYNAVIVLVSNDESKATEAWKLLMATASRPNAYILAGGVNRWLSEYAGDPGGAADGALARPDETLRHPVTWALGSRHPAALPDPHQLATRPFTKRVKLQKRVVKKGGCG